MVAAAVLGGLAMMLAVSWFLVERGVQRVLQAQATLLAEQWAEQLSSGLPEADRLIEGRPPTSEQIRFLRHMSATANVFRWRLYDDSGALTFDTRFSDELTAGWSMPAGTTVEESLIRTGAEDTWPRTYVGKGNGSLMPRHYAVGLDRLVAGEERVGTLEIFIDQTEQRAVLLRTLLLSGLYPALLAMVAFLVLVAGLLWQVRVRAAADAAREHAATHDSLTGLLNRYAFGEVVDGVIARDPERPFHLHSFDIRGFRKLNEARGHAIGDEVIRWVAWRLQRQVGDRSAVCRLGSDEFALVDATRPALHEARTLAEACLRDLRQPLRIKGQQLSLSIDCSIAQYPRDGADAAQLLARAGLALDLSAEEEGGTVRVFQPAMEIDLARRLNVEGRLRRAVEAEDFRLVFQPFYRPSDGRLLGAEALLRLDHPDGGAIPPSKFISVAEETRLIIPLGWLVLRHACTIAARWPDDLLLAVNLSPIEFDKNGPVESARQALSASGLPPHRLEIEVTESTLIANPDRVALQLDQLKEMGVRLALDDFGTGYSSLGHVAKYPFDRLKIDRSFVANLTDQEPRTGQMLRIIAAIGGFLGLDVTAEGIETEAQAAAVERLGIAGVQGFHYSRPLDLQDFEREIAARSGPAAVGAGAGGLSRPEDR